MLRLFAVVLVISIPYIEGILNSFVVIWLMHVRYFDIPALCNIRI